jgi:hypothetical protein
MKKKLLITLSLFVSVLFSALADFSDEELLTYLDALNGTEAAAKKITSVGRWAFAYNALKTVKIPSGITLIGEGAFANNELTELVLPATTQTIEGWAFANNNISTIVFPLGTTYIGDNAFLGNKLTDITIGDFVYIASETINGAFYDWYIKSERKAGRYILENGAWKKL